MTNDLAFIIKITLVIFVVLMAAGLSINIAKGKPMSDKIVTALIAAVLSLLTLLVNTEA